MATTTTLHERDDYWKLQAHEDLSASRIKEILTERGYHFTYSAVMTKLRHSLWRSDMGLISYINLNNRELRRLIRERRIDPKDIIKGRRFGQRHELLGLLEDADRNPSFHRFLDLPPELRIMVYEYYFEAFFTAALPNNQPPLLKTCTLIRGESLKLFYRLCTFDVPLENKSCRFMLAFLRTPVDHLALIRTWRFSDWPFYQDRSFSPYGLCVFDVKLSGTSHQPGVIEFLSSKDISAVGELKSKIQSSVQAVLDRIAATKSKPGFELEDVIHIQTAKRGMHATWN